MRLRCTFLLLFTFVLAALQTFSIYNYQGEKVDESELVHYAVGFLSGDLDPKWYGYGTLGMYLLGAIYFVSGLGQIFAGYYDSFLAYASQVYENGYFIIIARYLFAFIGICTALILSLIHI